LRVKLSRSGDVLEAGIGRVGGLA